MRWPSLCCALATASLCVLAACSERTDPPGSILWRIDGERNTVYLLGSVHLLREGDYPLPAVFATAYEEAEHLIMELDMDDLDPVALQQAMFTAGLIDNGGTLQSWLGEEAWARATAGAAALQIDLGALQLAEPWFAALTIIEGQMLRLGYDPAFGIEMHFSAQAVRDGKRIEGLESIDQQIAFFDQLPRDTQRRFLLKAIDDAQALEDGMQTLIGAWKRGDTRQLETELVDSFEGFADVYRSLVVERNRAWLAPIEALLNEADDYLVIVGALHLIGPDSVVELLRERGHRVQPLDQTSTISKSSLPAPQSGQRHESGTSSQRVPGAIPASGSPASSL